MIYVEVVFKPIGVVHLDVDDEYVRNSLNGVAGVVEVYPEFADGLTGIDGFSHIILIAYLHKVVSEGRGVLRVRPRRLIRLGINVDEVPEVGVFCTDSPHRPNPIALSIVRLVRRDGRFLYVEGLDLFNGTPVLDIRAYTPDRAIADVKLPNWYQAIMEKIKSKLGADIPP